MTDDQLELVNAYLDGEATVDERTLVESDPALLAEVERMRSVRNALSEAEPPSVEARESAIAAALAAFDELPATGLTAASPGPAGDVTAPTNIVPFERRRRMRRLQGLSAAAAAVVIVAGGIAIVQRGNGGNDADAPRESNTIFEAPAQYDEDTSPGVEATSTTAAPMMAQVPTTIASAAADEAADGAVGGAVTSEPVSAEMAAPSASAPESVAARLVVLRTEDDLTDFAATLKDAPPAADGAETQCADRILKAEATYEDDEGAQHPIVVVMIDEDGERLGALSLDSCEIVLQVD